MLSIEKLFLKNSWAWGLDFFVKQKKLLLGNGKKGILFSMGSVRVTNMGCG